ncbi:MAG: NAD-dependent epimerase/dehydratase family protein [Vicinamibacterales bacterium]
MGKRILVTGGFGFVGGHLVETLLTLDPANRVHVVDNLTTNPLPLDRLLSEIHARVGSTDRLTWDICSVADWFARKPVDTAWDEIYHLASVVGPAGVLRHAGRIVKAVVDDAYVLMEVATARGIRLLEVSTSEVYGGGQEGDCNEDFAKIIPARTSVRLEYAVAKLAAETALQNTCLVGSLDAVIVRPFNISGPRQSGVGGFVLPRFIGSAIMNRPLTIFSGGTQTRAFTHVADICDGLVLAMQHGRRGEVYNLGNPKNRVTINEMAELVLDVTGSTAGKTYVDPRTIYGPLYAEANDKYPNADRAMRELTWVPRFDARAVVQETFDYMRRLPEDVRTHLVGPGV